MEDKEDDIVFIVEDDMDGLTMLVVRLTYYPKNLILKNKKNG
jgi:hypothetical protein